MNSELTAEPLQRPPHKSSNCNKRRIKWKEARRHDEHQTRVRNRPLHAPTLWSVERKRNIFARSFSRRKARDSRRSHWRTGFARNKRAFSFSRMWDATFPQNLRRHRTLAWLNLHHFASTVSSAGFDHNWTCQLERNKEKRFFWPGKHLQFHHPALLFATWDKICC